jgi:hypothetical protein
MTTKQNLVLSKLDKFSFGPNLSFPRKSYLNTSFGQNGPPEKEYFAIQDLNQFYFMEILKKGKHAVK